MVTTPPRQQGQFIENSLQTGNIRGDVTPPPRQQRQVIETSQQKVTINSELSPQKQPQPQERPISAINAPMPNKVALYADVPKQTETKEVKPNAFQSVQAIRSPEIINIPRDRIAERPPQVQPVLSPKRMEPVIQRQEPKEEKPQVIRSVASPRPSTAEVKPVEEPCTQGKVLCMQCVNEDIEGVRKIHDIEEKARDKEYIKRNEEAAKRVEQEKLEEERQKRLVAKEQAEEYKEIIEKRRKDHLEAKKSKPEDEEDRRKQREYLIEENKRSREFYKETMQKYNKELDEQMKQIKEHKSHQAERETSSKRESTGLPLPPEYQSPDYRKEVAKELIEQMEARKKKKVVEKLEDVNYQDRIRENLTRIREEERRQREDAEKAKRMFLSQGMNEWKTISEKRKAEKEREKVQQRREADVLAEQYKKAKQEEIEQRLAKMAKVNHLLEEQLSARKEKQRQEQTAKKETVYVSRTAAKVHTCDYVNCTRCKRKIPAYGAFPEEMKPKGMKF